MAGSGNYYEASTSDHLNDIAEILAEGIVRMRLRETEKRCKFKKMKSSTRAENCLEVSAPQSLHGVEPPEKGEKL